MLDQDVTQINGVGKILAEKLDALQIHTISDLIFHLPIRYQDRTRITALNKLEHGKDALICASIENTSIGYGKRRSFQAIVYDGTATLTIRWFNISSQQKRYLQIDCWIIAYGNVRLSKKGYEMNHPEYQVKPSQPNEITTDKLTPIYPLTKGITQPRMRSLVAMALKNLGKLEDHLKLTHLPAHYPDLITALLTVHQPHKDEDTDSLLNGSHKAQKRLALEELLAHHLSLMRIKAGRKKSLSAKLNQPGQLTQQFISSLPFILTNAQIRVCKEILIDIAKNQTMHRLVQGDVGSGKTVVAAVAICKCITSGFQSAIMAPTELLAEQHYKTLCNWFEKFNIHVQWLASNINTATKRTALSNIASGKAQIVVGTQALFQQGVNFNNLGLAVVDEQHRFGVNQRLTLLENAKKTSGVTAHLLSMTATPIPRTLAMIFYADMDISTIDELPPNRGRVDTVALPDSRRNEVVERIHHACQSGRQAYWVCSLIEESETIQAQTVLECAKMLQSALLDVSIGVIHGKLNSEEKNNIMRRFRDGELDILVATTVIEVGVDVAKASLMIIENPERLGLAQLHQLRGRIGRGQENSCCVLLYRPPLGQQAKERLSIMRVTQDGFEISKFDLKLRGPGELLGTKQAGMHRLRIANLVRDQHLFSIITQIAKNLVAQHPQFIDPIIDRWIKNREELVNV